MERAWKPSVEISPNCPRCGSSNTKFCYYNNYSLTQPRYFCKGCRRYWTKGGSLRNVPVGGGCRKNRRGNNNNKSLLPSNYPSSDNYVNARPKDADGSGHSTAGSHIDLALVYANFLNSDKTGGAGIPDLPVDFDPALALPNMDLDSGGQLSDGSNNQLGCFGELDSVLDHSGKIDAHRQVIAGYDNFGLPPFPGEEVGSHHHHHQDQCLWSNSASSSVVHQHGNNVHAHALMQSSSSTNHLLGIEPEGQDPNLVTWSPFDLSTFDNFSRP